jgi:putative glutamine amidotransferase
LRRNFSLSGPAVCDAARDAMELSLVRACLEKGKPVLGICRGAQMLNAALGGSLHQEIRELYTESPYIRSVFPRKRIQIVADSLLASILPRPVYWVNSLHHQAVHQVAPGLKVVAREDNELVQAIEFPGHPFVLGVQWHPEFLPQASTQQAIFRKLIQVAGFKPL